MVDRSIQSIASINKLLTLWPTGQAISM